MHNGNFSILGEVFSIRVPLEKRLSFHFTQLSCQKAIWILWACCQYSFEESNSTQTLLWPNGAFVSFLTFSCFCYFFALAVVLVLGLHLYNKFMLVCMYRDGTLQWLSVYIHFCWLCLTWVLITIYMYSGGYNIKTGPGCSIELMKFDMGGSAAVLGAAKALGQIKPPGVEVRNFVFIHFLFLVRIPSILFVYFWLVFVWTWIDLHLVEVVNLVAFMPMTY